MMEMRHLNSHVETSNVVDPAKRNYYDIVNAFMGWLGATVLLIMGLYIFTIYFAISAYDPAAMERLLFPVYFATVLIISSTISLIYGSYLIWRTSRRKGGIINLFAATVIPVPTYIYFAFLSQPTLLGWLNHVGWFLLAPAIISGAMSIYFSQLITRVP